MITRSTVACYTTPNIEPLWLEFSSSLVSAGGSRDKICRKESQDLPDDPKMTKTFKTGLWYRSVAGKVRWFSEVLKKAELGDFVICSDVDIWFPAGRADGWNELGEFLDLSPNLIFMAKEPYSGPSGPANSGFIVVKKEAFGHIAEYFAEVALRVEKTRNPKRRLPYGDQSVFNQDVKNGDIVGFDYLPDRFCSLGPRAIRKKAHTMLFHHAIETENTSQKMNQINAAKKATSN